MIGRHATPAAAVAVCLLAICGPKPAVAAPAPARSLSPQSISGTQAIAIADARYVIRSDATGSLVALDSVRRTSKVAPPGCVGAGAAAHYELVRCPADGAYFAFNLATGGLLPVAADASTIVSAGDFGERWLLTSNPDGGYAYLNWRTGQRVPAGATPDRDTDSPELAPLPTVLRGDTVVASSRRTTFPRTPLKRLRMRYRGETITVTRRCAGAAGCTALNYQRGVLTWHEGPTVYAYLPSRRLTYRVEISARVAQRLNLDSRVPIAVTHTRTHIYLTAQRENPGPVQYANFSAALPQNNKKTQAAGR